MSWFLIYVCGCYTRKMSFTWCVRALCQAHFTEALSADQVAFCSIGPSRAFMLESSWSVLSALPSHRLALPLLSWEQNTMITPCHNINNKKNSLSAVLWWGKKGRFKDFLSSYSGFSYPCFKYSLFYHAELECALAILLLAPRVSWPVGGEVRKEVDLDYIPRHHKHKRYSQTLLERMHF